MKRTFFLSIVFILFGCPVFALKKLPLKIFFPSALVFTGSIAVKNYVQNRDTLTLENLAQKSQKLDNVGKKELLLMRQQLNFISKQVLSDQHLKKFFYFMVNNSLWPDEEFFNFKVRLLISLQMFDSLIKDRSSKANHSPIIYAESSAPYCRYYLAGDFKSCAELSGLVFVLNHWEYYRELLEKQSVSKPDLVQVVRSNLQNFTSGWLDSVGKEIEGFVTISEDWSSLG